MTYRRESIMSELHVLQGFSSDAKVLEVRKDGDRFIGDLKFSDGNVWMAWQVFKRLYELKANARAAGFEGPIVRI